MPWVTNEQITKAREIDLLSYLQASEPNELLPTKNDEYRTVTHGSLVISNGKWIWNRGKIAGHTALDFLIKMRGMKFNDAVETVLGSTASYSSSTLQCEINTKPLSPKQWTFYLPKPVRYPSRAVSYLQQRGIRPEVINCVIQAGIFYESRYYNPESEYHNVSICVSPERMKPARSYTPLCVGSTPTSNRTKLDQINASTSVFRQKIWTADILLFLRPQWMPFLTLLYNCGTDGHGTATDFLSAAHRRWH